MRKVHAWMDSQFARVIILAKCPAPETVGKWKDPQQTAAPVIQLAGWMVLP